MKTIYCDQQALMILQEKMNVGLLNNIGYKAVSIYYAYPGRYDYREALAQYPRCETVGMHQRYLKVIESRGEEGIVFGNWLEQKEQEIEKIKFVESL